MDDFKTLLSVEGVADKNITSVASGETIKDVAKAMLEKESGSVLVTGDDGRLMGIVTESDIVRRGIAKDLNIDSASVSEIMTKDPITIPSDESIFEARKIMEGSKAHHLVVLKEGRPFGILTTVSVMGNK